LPKTPSERGSETGHVDLRAGGIGIDKWRGVVREGDAAAIPDSALWYAENSRLLGGKIITRGGQAAVNTVAAEGCIDGFFDAGDMGAQDPSTYVSPGFYASNGASNFPSKIDTDGTFSVVVSETTDNFARYDDYIYYRATITQFKRFELGTTSSANTFALAKIDANDVGASMGGTANGYLYLIYGYHSTLTPTNGRIYQWDGTTATSVNSFAYADTSSEITFDTNDQWRLFPFNSGWVASCMATNTVKRFMYRNAAGTLTFPRYAGTLAALDTIGLTGQGRCAVLGSKIYMPVTHDIDSGNFVTMIQSFDGTTVAVERTLETAPILPTIAVGGIVTFGSAIYWAYIVSGATIRLGKYDGTTWTDNFATVATGISGSGIRDINEHDGSLYVFTDGNGAYKSDGSDLTSWTNINPTANVKGMTVSVGE
jgi:hypothetical protein